ncbi:MAG: peptidoglycan-binding protein [Potamolinea sp.]
MQTSDNKATAAALQAALINKPILQQGSQGDAVRELQQLLTTWGTYNGSIDGIFGSRVKSAVIAYQHRVFLIEDGIVGSLTWQALFTGAPVNMPVLSQGSFGDTVILLQRLLTTTKDYTSTIDGDFGSRTKKAVQTFQTRSQIVADGIVNFQTWHALSKVPH